MEHKAGQSIARMFSPCIWSVLRTLLHPEKPGCRNIRFVISTHILQAEGKSSASRSLAPSVQEVLVALIV